MKDKRDILHGRNGCRLRGSLLLHLCREESGGLVEEEDGGNELVIGRCLHVPAHHEGAPASVLLNDGLRHARNVEGGGATTAKAVASVQRRVFAEKLCVCVNELSERIG